ncbi:hypothetical protein [Mesorhizobium sp. LNJC403B00]|uniref:hypothetical protein n=1 Tax=Mesorhizobium sp. LNJC403B00 TaxID=1287280 RepID=UPI0012EC5325|nr:hypothetical protein [Mesorhizobium sp. LNJC403B00]
MIVGFIEGGSQQSILPTGELSLSAGTNSCNAGNQNLAWLRLPNSRHPVISLNIYQIRDGQIRQIAASWVKHGFFATNQDACRDIKGVPACVPAASDHLGPGCSDPYGESLNANPSMLGPRSRINPATGAFDGATARDPEAQPIDDALKALVVSSDTLSVPDAKYFVEAHYITEDDATAGNYRNNMTTRSLRHSKGRAFSPFSI